MQNVRVKLRKRRTKYKWHASFTPVAEEVSREWKKARNNGVGCPKYQALRSAKKLLRKAQRQAAARQRRDVNQAIIDACKGGDRDSYHKLVRKQRKPPSRTENIEFEQHTDPNGYADSWANYLQYLALPQEDETFDQEYQRHLQFTHLLQTLTSHGVNIEPVTLDDITKHVRALKNGKACDIHGIAAEHIKLSSPIVADILCHLVNMAVLQGKLPSSYKVGCVTLYTGKPSL